MNILYQSIIKSLNLGNKDRFVVSEIQKDGNTDFFAIGATTLHEHDLLVEWDDKETSHLATDAPIWIQIVHW